eukprot:gene19583-25486_t
MNKYDIERVVGEVLFVQISLAIKHIHDRKILHRDLKSDNIFLTSNGLCKLGDFGVSRVLRNTSELASTQIGTPYYMSPEIMEGKKYNSKTDIWSLGCVLYELTCLRLPFDGINMRQLSNNIQNRTPASPPDIYSKDLKDLTLRLLVKNPKVRPSINTVLSQPIIKLRISNILSDNHIENEFSHTVLHGVNILTNNNPSNIPPYNSIPISKPFNSDINIDKPNPKPIPNVVVKPINDTRKNVQPNNELDRMKLEIERYNKKLLEDNMIREDRVKQLLQQYKDKEKVVINKPVVVKPIKKEINTPVPPVSNNFKVKPVVSKPNNPIRPFSDGKRNHREIDSKVSPQNIISNRSPVGLIDKRVVNKPPVPITNVKHNDKQSDAAVDRPMSRLIDKSAIAMDKHSKEWFDQLNGQLNGLKRQVNQMQSNISTPKSVPNASSPLTPPTDSKKKLVNNVDSGVEDDSEDQVNDVDEEEHSDKDNDITTDSIDDNSIDMKSSMFNKLYEQTLKKSLHESIQTNQIKSNRQMEKRSMKEYINKYKSKSNIKSTDDEVVIEIYEPKHPYANSKANRPVSTDSNNNKYQPYRMDIDLFDDITNNDDNIEDEKIEWIEQYQPTNTSNDLEYSILLSQLQDILLLPSKRIVDSTEERIESFDEEDNDMFEEESYYFSSDSDDCLTIDDSNDDDNDNTDIDNNMLTDSMIFPSKDGNNIVNTDDNIHISENDKIFNSAIDNNISKMNDWMVESVNEDDSIDTTNNNFGKSQNQIDKNELDKINFSESLRYSLTSHQLPNSTNPQTNVVNDVDVNTIVENENTSATSPMVFDSLSETCIMNNNIIQPKHYNRDLESLSDIDDIDTNIEEEIAYYSNKSLHEIKIYLIEKLALFQLNNVINKVMVPLARSFIPLSTIEHKKLIIHSNLRVLQFNILADGLAGLRADFGGFSRVHSEDIIWDNRKHKLIHEIIQYNPDIITLQECDHYYDFFLPQLNNIGYDGLYAPKPASACLEVSPNADGCCIFVKRSKIKFVSSETLTFTLSQADINEESTRDEDKQIRVQNQVALIAICELMIDALQSETDSPPPQLVIATTHLKAMKTVVGEKYRVREVLQLLDAVTRVINSLQQLSSKPPAVIITGDLNASPTDCATGYPALTYATMKNHSLGLRSVLNDDIPRENIGVLGKLHQTNPQINAWPPIPATAPSVSDLVNANPGIWTTWKARFKKGNERIMKHCIDYILYSPQTPTPSIHSKIGIRAINVLDLFDDASVSEKLLPSDTYPSDHLAIAADLQIIEFS